jgi:hypothetical protein
MNSNQCIIPECYVDSCLVEVLLYAGKNHVNHQKGNGTVTKEMRGKFVDGFCVGIIDEDRKDLDYLKEFTLLKETDHLKLWKHKDKHHFIIQLRPVIEQWILYNCNKAGIDLTEFELPSTVRQLMKVSKSTTSKSDTRFVQLFKKMVNHEVEAVMELKKWLEYLRNNNYQADIKELMNA